jgi:hypothetical protein
MSVIVVVRRRARPGQEGTLLREWVRQVEAPAVWSLHRRAGRLFEDREAPGTLLYVGDWETRAAFWARTQENAARERLDALSHASRYAFFEPLVVHEVVDRPMALGEFTFVQAGTRDRTTVLGALHAGGVSGAAAGAEFVARYLCVDLADPEHFFVFQAWEAAAADGLEPLLQRALAGTAARIERVVASARFERDRLGAWPVTRTALASA